MLISDLQGVLRRRWLLICVGIVVTTGLCLVVTRVVPARYEARALLVLLPPKSLVSAGGNPYLALGGLDTAGGVLSAAINTDEVAQRIARISPTAVFAVGPDLSTPGPVLSVIVDDLTGAKAVDAVDALLGETAKKLAEMQAATGAPLRTYITTSTIMQDTQAQAIRKSQVRAALGSLALGLSATMIIASLVDRRKLSKASRPQRSTKRRLKRRPPARHKQNRTTTQNAGIVVASPVAPDAPSRTLDSDIVDTGDGGNVSDAATPRRAFL